MQHEKHHEVFDYVSFDLKKEDIAKMMQDLAQRGAAMAALKTPQEVYRAASGVEAAHRDFLLGLAESAKAAEHKVFHVSYTTTGVPHKICGRRRRSQADA